MRPVGLLEICDVLRAKPARPASDARAESVSTDTRTLEPGALFFAIRGPNFDGHDFVEIALEKGAAAVVVDRREVAAQLRDSRVLLVNDALAALGKLAAWYRRSLAAQVIAVLGSNGKTTTKDLVHAVLGSRLKGTAAEKSFNNAIGVALTLLAAAPTDQYVITEIGTNAPGEIAALSRIVCPDYAIVTSIAEEHLEGFGSLEGVAAEEFSFLPNLTGRATVVLSEQAAPFAPRRLPPGCRAITYGISPEAPLRIGQLEHHDDHQSFVLNERFRYRLPLMGQHNVHNALAAITIGTAFRLEHDTMARALKKVTAPPMRLNRMEYDSICVINDAYNANPGSMRAAFEAIDHDSTFGRKVFILGDMRELGTAAGRCHEAVGEAAGRSSAAVIITVGAFARHTADGAVRAAGTRKRIYSFPSVDVLQQKLPQLLQRGDRVLLKASRGVALEKLLPTIEAWDREHMATVT